MAVESGFAQPLWITVLGMAVTFGALALVMVTMVLLARLVREARSPAGENAEGTAADAVDLELPAGTEMAELLAAVVAVAAARQLAQQRHSARVWLRAEPRSLVSPWQLVARGWQMDRWRR